MTDNTDKLNVASVGNPLYADLTTSSEQVYLNARYQVATKCSETCRNFRFGTTLPALSTGVVSAYGSIKTMAWLGGLGALVCVVYLIFVIWAKAKATQKMYVRLYVLALALCFILWVMTSIYLSRVGRLRDLRTAFMANAGCITDADWATVFTKIGAATDLGGVWTWLIIFMLALLLCFLVGVCVLCHVMKKLAQCQNWRE